MKKLNDNASATGLVVIVFTSLIFSTVLISWFLLQMYGVTIAGIDLPQGQIQYSGTQNFTSNQINTSIINIDSISKWEYILNEGRILTQKGRQVYTYLLINNVRKDKDGLIKNHYVINNSVKGNYVIVLRYQSAELEIKSDGVYLPVYFVDLIVSEKKLLSYPNMNKVQNVIIDTVYNEDYGTCEFTFNGVVYSLSDIPRTSNTDGYYGGVGSNTLGFMLNEYITQSPIIYDSSSDVLAQFSAFVVIALRLVFYNVDPAYLPWELNILLVKTQTIALLIGIINMRSGS